MTEPLKVGKLPYLNVLPFFMDDGVAVSHIASPRALGRAAEEGLVDAGPFSLVDAWRLEAAFEPLGGFGIAVKGPARSVLLYSRCPLEDLDRARIGVSEESSTSVRLLQTILRLRDGVTPSFVEGFSPEDTARLLIGDRALLEAKSLSASFPLVFDLGREWYTWRERPFVFARWMVRRTAAEAQKDDLAARLDSSLKRFENSPDAAVWKTNEKYPFSPAVIRNYLSGFVYRLGPDEREAEDSFRALTTEIFQDEKAS